MMKIKFNALKVNLLLLAAALLLSPNFMGLQVQAKEGKQSSPERITQTASLPNSFDDYKKECLVRASREGLPQDVARDLCNCTIKRFQSQYSFPQFRALVQKSQKDRTAARALTAVGEACFDEVLYEE